ncbi:fluoride efflux transporter CrcB [uncultured Ruminococcus sp.]|uniref:fluoride efflux transporter CrcB n=1 Tax=uncultured Ruminococcus sp. TaxID=165186 RepID=UPI002602135A|nr:fluoride efflux transporter CrcB [uncultured Ruminococcus sp.]
MLSFILVGCGGALGAMLRYAIGLIPVRSTFPVLTLVINFLGAVAIGLIAEAASAQQLSQKSTLFWKTGVCGGFTTFSTFSLEAMTLFQERQWLLGSLYVVLSVAGCLCGVLLGKLMQHRLFA